ncbi:hypothetical protein A9R05_42450 (plasmid) [Burkholderia sp. KK1]|uniref:Uncharacterized protein n=1 Tax=Burkholderia sp. M701 TaxID=326454 RepID=V5YPR7_9BURK|nr:hypothetical protein [Burkholderia sp. M701]AQH05682.1 hypothetical protein A9R05_42450 [Burkholderia sp. KK1]BAO18926.1 hypothetical protein [Burkholderia sp. M701]
MPDQFKVVPHPRLKRDYTGRTVRLTRDLSNGWGVIPSGAIATIEVQNNKGSTLLCAPCLCCGLKARISAIQPGDIEFVERITGESDSRLHEPVAAG